MHAHRTWTASIRAHAERMLKFCDEFDALTPEQVAKMDDGDLRYAKDEAAMAAQRCDAQMARARRA